MRFKKSLLVICIIICLFAMASVSASDVDDAVLASDSIENDIVVSSESSDLDGTFEDLASEIANAESELNLTRNYLYGENDTQAITIDKSIIINGNGHIIDANNKSGILVVSAEDVTINNLTFINANSNLGSVFNVRPSSSLTTNNVILENNTANLGVIFVFGQYSSNNDQIIDSTSSTYGVIDVYTGGAAEFDNTLMISSKPLVWGFVYAFDDAYLDIYNSTFINTTSKYNVAVHGSKMTRIKNSKFINLHANATAGAIGIKKLGNFEIDKCTFINVTSEKDAGAIYVDVHTSEDYNPVLINNSNFVNSYSQFGGAIMQLGGDLIVDNCNFTDNSALFDGGAIYTSYAAVSISNSLFDGNNAQYNGTDRPTYGGTVFCDAGEFNLVNCTMDDSFASLGGAVYLYDCEYYIADNTFNNNGGNDIFTVFDATNAVLENNTYSGNDTVSWNNTNYETIMAAAGMKLVLINNLIDVAKLPSRFDLRDWGWVTPVRDQGSMGSCWTFGTAGAIESAILRYLGLEMDISENNMQDVSLQYYKYGTKSLVEAGSILAGASYALSWFGVFSSIHDSYDELGKISPIIAAQDSIHFQDVVFIAPRKNVTDNDLLKEALLKYGALGVTYYAAQSAPYYNGETAAQYCNETLSPNHGVSLIGWDDSYSASNFLITPPDDGAWIFKNSWGESVGDKGYFYISYYDPNFATSIPSVGFVLENTVEYNKNYQYDIGGTLDYYSSNEYVNIYSAVEDDVIAGVGTYFKDEGVEYSVEVYVNDDLKLNQSGVSPFAGFHTIQLDSFVPIKKGDEFAVKITSNAVPVLKDSRQHYIEGASQYLDNGVWVNASDSNMVCSIKVYTIDEQNTTIMAEYDSANKVVTATLTNDKGDVIGDADVVIDFNGDTYTDKTDSEGQVKVSTKDLTPGSYTATFSYDGGMEYCPANTTLDFDVKTDMIITGVYDGSKKEIVATLTNAITGKTIANAKVQVELNGVNSTAKSNSKGQVKVSTADLPAGEYTAVISYAGNAKYNPASTNVTTTKMDMVISAVYNVANEELVATLTSSATGKVVANANAEVNINGLITTAKSNSKGRVTVSTADLPSGTYNATVSYAGNAKYNPASTNITFTTKADMVISNIHGNLTELAASLTNGFTGKNVSNANIAVNINGVTTNVKSNSKGQIKVPVTDLTGNSYTATISFKGNSKYNAASTTTTIIIGESDVIISAAYDADNKQIAGTLSDANGSAIADAQVEITLNGTGSNVTTDDAGQFSLSLESTPTGNYTATIAFDGNENYNKSNVTFDLIINKAAVNIAVVSAVSYDNFTVFRINLTDSETGNALGDNIVNLLVDDENLLGKTDENGIAEITSKFLPKGNYSAVIKFYGTDYYAARTVTDNIYVYKYLISNLTSDGVSTTYGADDYLVVSLTGDDNQSISGAEILFTVFGKNLTDITDSLGQAKIPTKGYGPGIYKVVFKYAGDLIHSSASSSAKITVHSAKT